MSHIYIYNISCLFKKRSSKSTRGSASVRMAFGSGVTFSPELAVVDELATVLPPGVSPFKFLFFGPGVAGDGVAAFTV